MKRITVGVLAMGLVTGGLSATMAAGYTTTAGTATATPAGAATTQGTISFLDHQKGVNQVMCEKMVGCKKAPSMEECVKRWNGMSEANPTNKTTMVSKAKSDQCQTALKTATCETVFDKSTSGSCALTALQGK